MISYLFLLNLSIIFIKIEEGDDMNGSTTYKVVGEGYQAKMLLKKHFNVVEDDEVLAIIETTMYIAQTTASNYLRRKIMPYGTFKDYLERTLGKSYSELIETPKDQIMRYLKEINNLMPQMGLQEKITLIPFINDLLKESIELKFIKGELFAKIVKSQLLFESNMEGYFNLIDEAVAKAKRLDASMYCAGLIVKSYILKHKNQMHEAYNILKRGQKKIFQNTNIENTYKREFYYQLGYVSYSIENYNTAEKYVSVSLDLSDNDLLKTRCYLILGSIAKFNADYTKALNYYNNALILSKTDSDRAIVFNNISNVHIARNNFLEAKEYVLFAIELSVDEKNIIRKINYYCTLMDIMISNDNDYNYFLKIYNDLIIEMKKSSEIYKNQHITKSCLDKLSQLIFKYNDKKIANKLIYDLNAIISKSNTETMINRYFFDTIVQLYDNLLKEEDTANEEKNTISNNDYSASS